MSKKAFIVSGGTGGHVFPALSLYQKLQDQGHHPIFITDNRGGRYLDETMTVFKIDVQRSHPIFKGTWYLISLFWQFLRSVLFLLKHRPHSLIGFGGYPTLPMMLAGQILGFKTYLHEQNALTGRANRLLLKLCKKMATSFEVVKFGHKEKEVIIGNPVRPDFHPLYKKEYALPSKGEPFNILIFAGSQGATIFSSVLPNALEKLSKEYPIHITQQCREEDIDAVQKLYKKAGISHTLKPFFDNMPALYEKAHLLIARSGASTVSEVCLAGLPSIFIPFAASLDGDQKENAKAILEKEASWMIEEKDLSNQSIYKLLTDILDHPKTLNEKSKKLKECAYPNAADDLAKLVLKG